MHCRGDSCLIKCKCASTDRGGTFTDCVCKVPDAEDIVIKILSVDPSNYDDAPTEAVRRALEVYTGRKLPRQTPLDLSCVGESPSTLQVAIFREH